LRNAFICCLLRFRSGAHTQHPPDRTYRTRTT